MLLAIVTLTAAAAWEPAGYAQPRDPAAPPDRPEIQQDFDVTIRISGTINGQAYMASGGGRGSVREGSLRLDLQFRSSDGRPLAFAATIASMWTSSCSTPTFARERGADAVNMFTLTRGNYDCIRQIKSGADKVLEYTMQVRAAGPQMTVSGTVNGSVEALPANYRGKIKEFLVPDGPGRIASLVGFRLGSIPIVARSEYRLPGQAGLPVEQIRISEAQVTSSGSGAQMNVVSIYQTTVAAVP